MRYVRLGVTLVSLLVVVACSSQQPKESLADSSPSNIPYIVVAQTEIQEPVVAAASPAMAVDPLNDQNGILAKRSAYYPFDVSVVQDEDKPMAQAHAKYLSEHANRKVRLEGNCDERGSNEYNLALGQRRADGVKKMLVLGGAKASQIDTISYGEERPRAAGHDEFSWHQNRRADLNYVE